MKACFQNIQVEGLREIMNRQIITAISYWAKDGKQVPLVPDSHSELAKGKMIFRICDALNVKPQQSNYGKRQQYQ